MDYLWIIVGTLAVIGVWLLLCKLKVIPNPYAKWSLIIAGAIGTFGGSLLVMWFMAKKGGKDPVPAEAPEVVREVGPTKEEVEAQGNAIEAQKGAIEAQKGAIEAAKEKADEIEREAVKIDAAEAVDLAIINDGGAVSGPTEDRISELRERAAAKLREKSVKG